MNKSLSDEQIDACLLVLYHGLLAIRVAGYRGDARRCADLADALHNLPDLIRDGEHRGWTMEQFVEMFLEPLAQEPECTEWKRALLRALPKASGT